MNSVLEPAAGPRTTSRQTTTLLRQVFQGSVWQGLSIAIGRVAPSVMTIILAWWLKPQALGVISFVLAYFTVLNFVADWSISYSVQTLIPENSDRIGQTAWTALFVRLGLSTALGLLCLGLDTTTGVFHGYGVYLAMLLIASSFATVAFVHNARCNFRVGALFSIGFQVGWVLIALLLVKAGMLITGPLLGFCMSFTLLGIPGFLLNPALRGHIAFLRPVAVEILRFGFWATVATVLGELASQVGILAMSYVNGDAATGIFKVAATFGMLPTLLGTMVLLPLMPVARQGLLRGDDISRSLILPILRYLLMLGLPMVAVGFVLAPAVIRTFVQQSYMGAVWPMRILLAANLLRMLVTAFSGILFVGDGLRELAKIQGSVAAVAVVTSVLLARNGGAIGVAIGLLISWLVGAVYLYRWFERRMPVRLEWVRYLRYAGSAVVTAAFTFLAAKFFEPGVKQLVVGGCVAGIVYTFLLWLQHDAALEQLIRVFAERAAA
jgi:O-antigen/teichoic acid export membrane protein